MDPVSGNWNGIVGQLVLGLGDVSSAGVSIISERAKVIDYSIVVYDDEMTLNMAAGFASRVPVDMVLYLKIFTAVSWACFGAVVVALSLSFLLQHAKGSRAEEDFSEWKSEKFGLLNAFGLVFALLLQRDFPVDRKTMSSR